MTVPAFSGRFDRVKLIWRTEPHSPRLIVGTLSRIAGVTSFMYDGVDLRPAESLGFRGYPGLYDLSQAYGVQAISSFSSRLPSRDRADFARLIEAWGGRPDMDDFTLLGVAFGRLPTDMFEFIPELEPTVGTRFLTDLAGVQNYAGSAAFKVLQAGTPLELAPNPSNEHDRHAVEVRHTGSHVAHVKRVHCEAVCRAFEAGLTPDCVLVRSRFNGVIHEVVVSIEFR